MYIQQGDRSIDIVPVVFGSYTHSSWIAPLFGGASKSTWTYYSHRPLIHESSLP